MYRINFKILQQAASLFFCTIGNIVTDSMENIAIWLKLPVWDIIFLSF